MVGSSSFVVSEFGVGQAGAVCSIAGGIGLGIPTAAPGVFIG